MSRLLAGLAVVPFALGLADASAVPRHPLLTFADTRITEASGLVARDGLFTTVNDSGDSGRVFTVDGAGRTVGVTSWPQTATDDEALAPLPDGDVLVGDIGDNLAQRDHVTLRVVPVGRGDREVTPTSYDLTYPGGPADAETLLVQPQTGRVLVVTKSFFGGTFLEAPRHLSTTRPTRLRAVGDAIAVATDGAFFPDGRHLLLRDYQQAVVYSWPGLRVVARFTLPRQPQGEGLAIDPRGRVFVTSEGAHAQVLRVPLPAAVRNVVTPPRGSQPPAAAQPVPDVSAHDQDPPLTSRGPSWWPWAAGSLIGVIALGVLLRSVRAR